MVLDTLVDSFNYSTFVSLSNSRRNAFTLASIMIVVHTQFCLYGFPTWFPGLEQIHGSSCSQLGTRTRQHSLVGSRGQNGPTIHNHAKSSYPYQPDFFIHMTLGCPVRPVGEAPAVHRCVPRPNPGLSACGMLLQTPSQKGWFVLVSGTYISGYPLLPQTKQLHR